MFLNFSCLLRHEIPVACNDCNVLIYVKGELFTSFYLVYNSKTKMLDYY